MDDRGTKGARILAAASCEFKTSGLSQAAFSREHQLNQKTFGGWVGRIDRKVKAKRKRNRPKSGVDKGEKNRVRVENWRRHVEAYKASGESQESYGKTDGIGQ